MKRISKSKTDDSLLFYVNLKERFLNCVGKIDWLIVLRDEQGNFKTFAFLSKYALKIEMLKKENKQINKKSVKHYGLFGRSISTGWSIFPWYRFLSWSRLISDTS